MDRPTNAHSFRSSVYSTTGMCATSQPLATLAGVETLKKGGTAADAAICMLNTLAVVEPFMTGLGGDMFGIYYDASKDEISGLNSSGQSPLGLNIELLSANGYKEMPVYGPLTITVPGYLSGIKAIYNKYGRLDWESLFQYAIDYAENGFPVSEIIAYEWHRERNLLRSYKNTAELYLPNERTPKPGDIFINKPLASTLKKIAEKGIDTFYQGPMCDQICNAMSACGSPLSMEDMSAFSPEWVKPLSINYNGIDVYELPPNCQGIAVLEMLNLISDYNIEEMGLNSSDYIHLMTEAKKFSFHDRDTKIGDPMFRDEDFRSLLSPQHVRSFKNRFDSSLAVDFSCETHSSNTVYVVAVDENRNVASFISSIFDHFGSGIVAGDTGILMQNRGCSFILDEDHPNGLKPGKRPLHTIIPSMVFKNEKPEFAFGVMGGHMQPQGHVQILNNLYRFNLGVQESSDQPRFFHDGKELFIEPGISKHVKRELVAKGHKIGHDVDVFGGYQGIWIDWYRGVLIGGSDLRKDGCAIGY
jgi:gamma-glutamyltranspeptidase/glutathione hydrolase